MESKNILLALILASLLVACGQKTEAPAPVAAPLPTIPDPPPNIDGTAGMVFDAKQAVLAVLKDPSSAQFQDLKGVEMNGDPTVCGKVNAKNAMGGYAGFKQFCWKKSTGLMGFSGEF